MSANKQKTPVYFLSHGGPNIMYDTTHPAYGKLQELGKEITSTVRPEAVVVFSAHWQAGGSRHGETQADVVEVNVGEQEGLIYDFYGFPSHYYKETFPYRGSKEVAGTVGKVLKDAGFEVGEVKRGLDHGVWSSFKCVFNPDTNPLNVPIVQVSLLRNEDGVRHHQLGQAVSALREQNILIIVSGMAVHNLRDFWLGTDDPMPYTVSFDTALKEAVEAPPSERLEKMVALLKREDARQAHPSFDHLLPIYVGAGAAGNDAGKRLWTLLEGSVSWAQFRFGPVGGSS